MRSSSPWRATLTGAAAVVLAAALAVPAAADDDATAPAPDGAATWAAWAQQAADDARSTDWAALAQAQGCELVDVEISTVVDPALNASMGAPADLAVTVVERTEQCDRSGAARALGAGGLESTSAAAAGGCSSTHGPGTACIARSGSYVTTSWRYTGSGTIDAYLRTYRVSSTSGCPTGTALGTSATQTYTQGTQRSLSVSAPNVQGYAGHVWRHVGLGSYTDWGAACGVL